MTAIITFYNVPLAEVTTSDYPSFYGHILLNSFPQTFRRCAILITVLRFHCLSVVVGKCVLSQYRFISSITIAITNKMIQLLRTNDMTGIMYCVCQSNAALYRVKKSIIGTSPALVVSHQTMELLQVLVSVRLPEGRPLRHRFRSSSLKL